MRRPTHHPIRVLLVEDSPAQRELLTGILQSSSEFALVGVASNGKSAISEAQRLRPDVIAMDIHLPICDGYEATRQIMHLCPTPIVLISNQGDPARRSMEALAAGALAVVQKPGPPGAARAADEQRAFLTTLRLMADVRVVTRIAAPMAAKPLPIDMSSYSSAERQAWLLAIAASTGGPNAVRTVLSGIGSGFPMPILIVQHIAQGFCDALAEWLGSTIQLPVHICQKRQVLLNGHVYLAPEGHHLVIQRPGIASIQTNTTSDQFCPSADRLFESVAKHYGSRAIGLVLSGMGSDGTRGLLALHAAGATTLAQDAASCVVYGMPRSAVEAGAISQTQPLDAMANTILKLSGQAAL